uniref:Reverse transcriptase n=1 Tax=Neogobius melanostomus TaxID=47308 RepID=A0A8C6UHF1_9GOBI
IITYLQNPDVTLPKLLSTLKEFGRLSGYKLNITKTQILTVNYSTSKSIKQNYKLTWDADKMKYLGVYISQDFNSLFPLNLTNCWTQYKKIQLAGLH